MSNQDIISPCISICKTDPVSGYCYGCGRSIEEIKMWKKEDTSNDWKKKNIHARPYSWRIWRLNRCLRNKSYDVDFFKAHCRNRRRNAYGSGSCNTLYIATCISAAHSNKSLDSFYHCFKCVYSLSCQYFISN